MTRRVGHDREQRGRRRGNPSGDGARSADMRRPYVSWRSRTPRRDASAAGPGRWPRTPRRCRSCCARCCRERGRTIPLARPGPSNAVPARTAAASAARRCRRACSCDARDLLLPVGAIVSEHHEQPRHERADTDGEPEFQNCNLHVSASAGRTGRLSITTVVRVSSNDVRTIVEGEREAARRRIADLERSFDAIVASVDTANTDDEHDPEGATLGFERAQVVSLLHDARGHLEALDRAVSRIDAGTHGVCEQCGGDIGDARLVARPSTRICVECARGGRSR